MNLNIAQDLISRGEYEGEAAIPTLVYDADTLYARNTWLGEVLRSPAHAKWSMEHFDSHKTPAMIFGQAVHVRLLEPHLYFNKVAVLPDADGRTKEGKAAKAMFLAAHAGKIAISAQDFEAIEQIAARIFTNDNAARLISGGKAEHSLFWKDERTGVHCKARLDYARFDADTIIDVKTTENAGLVAFEKSIANFSYHRQAAYYTQGAAKILGRPIPNFVFIAIEKEPPFEFGLYRLHDAAMERGQQDVELALDRIAECQKSGQWPGYGEEIQNIAIPSWAF